MSALLVVILVLSVLLACVVTWMAVYRFHVLGSWDDCGEYCDHSLTEDAVDIHEGYNPSMVGKKLMVRRSSPDKADYQMWRMVGFMWSRTDNTMYEWDWEKEKCRSSKPLLRWRKQMSEPSLNKMTWMGAGRDIMDLRIFQHHERGLMAVGCAYADDMWSPVLVELEGTQPRILEASVSNIPSVGHEKNWTVFRSGDGRYRVHTDSKDGRLSVAVIEFSGDTYTLEERTYVDFDSTVTPPPEGWSSWKGGCNWLLLYGSTYLTSIHTNLTRSLDSKIYRSMFLLVDFEALTARPYGRLACMDRSHSKIQFVTCLTRDPRGRIWVGMGINDTYSKFVRMRDDTLLHAPVRTAVIDEEQEITLVHDGGNSKC